VEQRGGASSLAAFVRTSADGSWFCMALTPNQTVCENPSAAKPYTPARPALDAMPAMMVDQRRKPALVATTSVLPASKVKKDTSKERERERERERQ
jgi:hypothetical protein